MRTPAKTIHRDTTATRAADSLDGALRHHSEGPTSLSPSAGDGQGSLPLADFDFLDSEEFAVSELVGRALAQFEDIVIPTPQQMSSVRQMNALRVMSLLQPEGQMRRGARYLHPSGAGKSTCAKILKQHLAKKHGNDPERKSILHVTLSTTGTPKSLASSILAEAGEEYATRGEAELLLERVKVAIEEKKVELIIIDELNHIKGKSLATEAGNTIKNIMTKGWAPVVLMGTSGAEPLVKNNWELKTRCLPQVHLRPYIPESSQDLAHWKKLMDCIDEEMVKRSIIARHTGLAALGKILCEASRGLIGEFHGIMMAALEAALSEGDDSVSYDRLACAVDEWALKDDSIDSNPFREETK
ncbi:ATP-binding protein [Novosphingobium rosa]|uniref:ATP-binding protein n=1 Tax=Novosphingobium rosa TaxID=76978 RepID=UPI0008332126|nr:ATP-binding protein [Novosphingobium rosa]